MTSLYAAAALASLAVPAFALETPHGSKADPRVQSAPYKPTAIIALHAAVGKAILVQLPGGETVTDVVFSDSADMVPPVIVANTVTFKAKHAMEAAPLFIYARKTDGTNPRVFKFEWDAKADAGDTQAFAVIVTDPTAAAAANAAARRKARAARQAAQIRAELNFKPPVPPTNTDYVARGSASVLGR